MRRVRALVALGLAATALGCGQDSPSAPAGSAPGPAGAPRPSAAGDTVARGREVYLAQCVACHNVDPAKVGPIGPAVQGASPELLTAKVLQGTYPDGYKPKRDSKVMPARPDQAPTIPDLAAYLR